MDSIMKDQDYSQPSGEGLCSAENKKSETTNETDSKEPSEREASLVYTKGFDVLPVELQLKIIHFTLPGPQLVVFDLCGFLHRRCDNYPKRIPVPVAMHVSSMFREEAKKKGYGEFIEKMGNGWKSSINFNTDTLFIPDTAGWSKSKGFLCPDDCAEVKHLMYAIRYRRLRFCFDDGEMSKEVDWDFLREKFPKLEELVIWTYDTCLTETKCRTFPSKVEGGEEDFPRDENVEEFPWWMKERHDSTFEEIEPRCMHGDYRVMRDVTNYQLRRVKEKHPEFNLKSIRWISGLEWYENCM